MWPNRRRKRETQNLEESIAYDNILEDDKINKLVMVYDEKTILLFGKPKSKTSIKKV